MNMFTPEITRIVCHNKLELQPTLRCCMCGETIHGAYVSVGGIGQKPAHAPGICHARKS